MVRPDDGLATGDMANQLHQNSGRHAPDLPRAEGVAAAEAACGQPVGELHSRCFGTYAHAHLGPAEWTLVTTYSFDPNSGDLSQFTQ